MDDWGEIPDVQVEPLPEESPSILGRIGQRAANAPSELLNDLMRLSYNVGFRGADQTEAVQVPKPYDIPEAKTTGEGIVDIGSNIAESLPLFLSGEGAGEGVARLAGAGPILSRMLRVGAGFGVQGLTDSPEHAAVEGAMGAGFGLAESVPGKLKYPAAAALGLITALRTKQEGGSDTRATVMGATNALLPLLAHMRARTPAAAAEAPEAMEQLLLGYNPAARALEDVQTARPIPGTGGPISYGGELAESTTRARPIFGTERSSNIIDADFTMEPKTPPSLLLPEPIMTEAERRRGMGVRPPEGSLIREPVITMGEVRDVVAARTPKEGRIIDLPNGDSVATLQSSAPSKAAASATTKSSGRVLLRTVLSHENEDVVKAAAKKLDLDFIGVQDNAGRYPNQLYFNLTTPGRETTIAIESGLTYKDLKNKVLEKHREYDAKETAAAVKESKAVKKVATLQSTVEPGSAASEASTSSLGAPLPEVEQVTLPQGLSVGNKAVATIEGEHTVGTIHRTVEPGTVRFVEKDGTAHDLPASKIRTLGQQPYLRSRETAVGGTAELERINEGEGTSTIKLKGGGKMRKSNFGEQGSISPEAAAFMAKYIAAPALGAFIGYAEDDQHRPGSAVIGAISGGLAGHMGGKIFRLLAAGHPEIKAAPPGARLDKLRKAIGADVKDFAKAVTGNEKMAAQAASRWGWASSYDQLARWINKNARIDIDITRMRDKAYGITEDLSRAIGDSVKALSRTAGIDAHFPTISNYFEGKISFATLQSKVPKEIADLAATAVQSRTALQNIISDSLGNGKLATAIKNSVGKYLTTTYRIFHDKKYMPTDDQIKSAARSLEKMFPGETLKTRIDHIHEYLHEVKANRALFGGSFAGAKGETLGTILTRYEGKLTPEFKEMLGRYENPLERMAFTGMKLVNGGKSAEFFNEVARGTKANGLRFAYTAEERQAAIATLQHESRYGYDPAAREAAAAKLEEVRTYVYNPSGASNGRLGGKWMDVKTRDQLANYDTATRLFKSPLARAIAETTNMIKYGKIILSPLQFTRQVIQLPILGMIARTTPVDWAKAFRVLNDESVAGKAEYSRLRRLGVLSGDPVGGMLRRDMRAMLDGTLDALLNDRMKEGLHKWEEIWRTPDLMIRVSSFLKKENALLEQGFDANTAADRAIDHMNRYTMNYGAVPAIVAKGRQLPFVNQYLSWTYETLRITKNLMEDARNGDVYAMGVLSTIGTVPFLVQSMAESQLSEKDRDEWNKVKNLGPAYNRQNFRFVQGRLPNGDFRYIDFTPLVIHDQFMRMIRGVMAGDTEVIKAANPFFGWENTPLLNVATTLISGRNRYTGDKLTGIADTADAIRKEVLPTLAGTELDRIQRALTPTENGGLGTMNLRTGQVNSISDILQTYLTSMRPYTLRPAFVKQQAVSDARDQIRSQQLVLRRVLSSNAAGDIKVNARKSFDEALKEILRSFHGRLGLPEISPESVTP